MSKDLTNSAVDRQNILNNPYAIAEIEKAAGIQGVIFEGKTVVLKEQVAAFFEVTPRTIENYLEQNADELSKNGYEVLKANRLKLFKEAIRSQDVNETDFGNIAKTPQLGIFDFRAFLNLAMLVSESERAKLLRQNGNEVLRGNRLKELKNVLAVRPAHEIDFVTKTTVLGGV